MIGKSGMIKRGDVQRRISATLSIWDDVGWHNLKKQLEEGGQVDCGKRRYILHKPGYINMNYCTAGCQCVSTFFICACKSSIVL